MLRKFATKHLKRRKRSVAYLEASEEEVDFTRFNINGQTAHKQGPNLEEKASKCYRSLGVEDTLLHLVALKLAA